MTPSATPPTVLIIGARGLLGRSLVKEYLRRGSTVRAARVEWDSLDTVGADLRAAVAGLLAASGDGEWRIVWTAGAGVTSTAPSQLDAEGRAQNALIAAITALPEIGRASCRERVF